MNENIKNHIINMIQAAAAMTNTAYAKKSKLLNKYYYGKLTALTDVLQTANIKTETEISYGIYKLTDVSEIYEVIENITINNKTIFKK